MKMIDRLVTNIKELVAAGYEYPEAEWEAIQNLKALRPNARIPSGETLVNAYLEAEGDE